MPNKIKRVLTHRMARSAVSNGTDLLGGHIDGRIQAMRRLRDVVEDLTADLGGQSRLSFQRQVLIRRAATIILCLELQETKWAERWKTDGIVFAAGRHSMHDYQQMVNCLRRVLESLGLDKVARDITPATSREVHTRLRSRGIDLARDNPVETLHRVQREFANQEKDHGNGR